MEARQDQLQLAGIGVDVADGEDALDGGFELLGVHGDQVLMQVEAPFGDGAKLHGEAEERQHGIAGDIEALAVIALHRRRGKHAALAL